VAQLDNPDLTIAPYLKELETMKAQVRRQIECATNDAAKLDAVSKFLFAESGFHGSRSDYYNPANSYMSAVLDDREGLPITLAILFLELAEAAGARDVAGIPLPTHFMVKHAPPNAAERIIDVFDGGKVLSRTQAIELVADNAESISDEHFQPSTKRAIVLRVLRNLLGLAQRSDQTADALRYLDTILAITPDSAPDRVDRARIRLRQGDRTGAREDVKWLIENDAPGVDQERLAEWFRTL
jgi:serine protease Do